MLSPRRHGSARATSSRSTTRASCAIVDRIKELIITGGFNVAPSEVEEAVRAHPDVEDCAVVGLPDEPGEQVVAAVVLKAGATFDEPAIRDFAAAGSRLQGAEARRAGRRPARSLIGKVLRRQVRNGLLEG